MKKLSSLGAILACLLAVAGCGGGYPSKPQVLHTFIAPSGQRSYQVKLPSGRIVIQAHSPALAEPPKGLLLPHVQNGVPTAEQWDSVTVATILKWARYVAGYVNGLYPSYWQMIHRWPVVVGISVFMSGGADCFDMEPGNPGPQNAGPWAKWQFTQGNVRPCEYSMLSWMPAIRQNLAAYGIPICLPTTQRRCVRLWDANWTYRQHLDSGYACTQFTNHAYWLNLDESTCALWFYTPVSTPKPHPTPKPKPPADPYHYKVLTPLELNLALHYDGARKQPKKYARYLKVLERSLAADAHNVWVAAHRPHGGGWNVRNRGVRYQAVWQRSLGNQVVR